jgi:hypothetical protein
VSRLATEAAQAYEAEQEAERQRRADALQALIAGSSAALAAALVHPDGTAVTIEALELALVHSDLDLSLVVWSDGATALATVRGPGDAWSIYLTQLSAGQWQRLGTPLTRLADIGRALAGG